jgi:carbamate kinase
LPSAGNPLENVRLVCAQLARVAIVHDMVLTHGNGPQVGLLAVQSAPACPCQPRRWALAAGLAPA